MSRSQPATKQWAGYDVEPIVLQKQSKYDPDMLSLPIVVAVVEDGDRDPRFDVDLEEYNDNTRGDYEPKDNQPGNS